METTPSPQREARLVSDSALYGVAAVVAKALALLTVPYLTRALSPEGFGVADLATSTAALLTLVAMFSGDIPAARVVGLAPDEHARRSVLASFVWATVAASVVLTAVLLISAPFIATNLWGDPELTPLAALSLVLVPVSAVQAALVHTQRIRGRAARFAALSLVDLLAQLGLAVAFVTLGFGPAGIVLGFIAGSAIGLGVAAHAARDLLAIRPDWRTATSLIASGIAFLPSVTMFVVADWALRSILANSLGSVAVAEVGVAIRVASAVSLVGVAFAMAWGPVGLARVHDEATSRHFGRVLGAYGSLLLAAAAVLALIGPELVPLVAGPGYAGAVQVLPGFAFAFAIAGAEYVLVIAAGVSERGSRVALAATLGAVAQIGIALLLIPAIGVGAVGLAAVIGRSASFLLLLVSIRSSILAPLPAVAAGGIIAFLGLVATLLAVSEPEAASLARWGAAAAITIGAAFLVGARVRRQRAGAI